MKTNALTVWTSSVLGAIALLCSPHSGGAAELTITSPTETQKLNLGGTLAIRATGELAKAILAEVAKGTANRKLTLYLGGVEIPGLLASYSVPQETGSPGAKTTVDLSMVVDRNSDDDASRKAWDALLRPRKGFDLELEVALAVGTGNPVPVEGPGGTRGARFVVSDHIAAGYVMGLICFLLCGLILYYNSSMLREEGKPENAFSLSRVQMAFWGVVVLSCFVGVAVTCRSLEHIPEQTLVLLGISAATGLTSAVMDSGAEVRATKKSAGNPAVAFFKDICIGDESAGFHRVQVVLWTIVLGAFFIWNVGQMMSMPEFSVTLLVLMGISNGTYLGFKTQEPNPKHANEPVIVPAGS